MLGRRQRLGRRQILERRQMLGGVDSHILAVVAPPLLFSSFVSTVDYALVNADGKAECAQ